ncbi:hypothetical protein B0H67DRAFT_586802 [Lasiosphaeris hirsuta]|uniref:Uncharacterized protein n=1 Tax=Lasiosphaeris hirsuta TaxID=260670 RepID=A0AA40DQQ2_9PEZI|nr:hypothetical protein B0H67DRAFT_586802 [Lasiosphaeris hirsuta]
MRRSIILNSPSIANIFRIALTSQLPAVHAKMAEFMKPGPHVPYDVLEAIRAEQGWGFWMTYFSLYGSVEMLPALKETVERAFSAVPGVRFKWREFSGGPGAFVSAARDVWEEEISHSVIPTLAPMGIVKSRGARGPMSASRLSSRSGRELYAWYLTAKQRTVDAGFDMFADFHVYPRNVNSLSW